MRVVAWRWLESDPGERWRPEGIDKPKRLIVEYRALLASQLATCQWATGQWQAAPRQDRAAGLADGAEASPPDHRAVRTGRPGVGRGRWTVAADLLGEAFGHGEPDGPKLSGSRPAVGDGRSGQVPRVITDTRSGKPAWVPASADVTTPAYLYPYVPRSTGATWPVATRPTPRMAWSDRVGAVDYRPRHPGDAARSATTGLLLSTGRGLPAASYRNAGARAFVARSLRRFWEWHLGPARPPEASRPPGRAPRRGGRAHRSRSAAPSRSVRPTAVLAAATIG